MRRFTTALLLTALAAAPASAAVLTVNCSGSAAFTTIQAAVNAAASGDTIVVEPCATPYLGAIIDNKRDLHLVSSGVGARGAREEGVQPPGAPLPPPPLSVVESPNGHCFEIRNNSFDVSVHNFMLQHCGGDGVRVDHSDDILIEGNHIVAPNDRGVRVSNSLNSKVTGNTLDGVPGTGIELLATAECLVADNRILGFGDGVFIDGGDHSKVYNNDLATSGRAIVVNAGFRHRLERNTAAGTGTPNIECGVGAVELDVIGNDAAAVAVAACSATVDVY